MKQKTKALISCTADLRLLFSHMQKAGFPMTRLICKASLCLHNEPEDQWSCRRSPSWPSKAQNLENIW